MIRYNTASAVALIASLGTANAETTIDWWHAMGGELGTKLEEIVQGFNDSQEDYTVVPSYKGTYPETMTAAIAAFRAQQACGRDGSTLAVDDLGQWRVACAVKATQIGP